MELVVERVVLVNVKFAGVRAVVSSVEPADVCLAVGELDQVPRAGMVTVVRLERPDLMFLLRVEVQ